MKTALALKQKQLYLCIIQTWCIYSNFIISVKLSYRMMGEIFYENLKLPFSRDLLLTKKSKSFERLLTTNNKNWVAHSKQFVYFNLCFLYFSFLTTETSHRMWHTWIGSTQRAIRPISSFFWVIWIFSILDVFIATSVFCQLTCDLD